MITQILSSPNRALQSQGRYSGVLRQLNSSVGTFGTDTLVAATGAIELQPG